MNSTLEGVRGQSHAPAELYPRGKDSTVPIGQEAGWSPDPVWTQRLEEKTLCLRRSSNLDRPVVQSVARHCTDLATPAPNMPVIIKVKF
jgi:hypothetical protein